MNRKIIIALIALFGLSSCNSKQQMEAFIQNEDFRLQIGKVVHFSYKANSCQMSFSRSLKTFRCQTDNTSDYYTAVFDIIPSNVGEKVKADLEWTTDVDILRKNNITLEVVKIEGDIVWLWSNPDYTGLSIRILE